MKAKKRLVLRVNELFHDLEGGRYHEKHDDIFQGELNRWDSIGKGIVQDSETSTRVFLDIGTGTGFVPLAIAPYLTVHDLYICSDISQNILNVAKVHISRKKFTCRFQYLKVDGEKFDMIPRLTVDYISVNSVLHHLPDLTVFFHEADRILKVGGRIVIGHEPNRAFFQNRTLWLNYQFMSYTSQPTQLITLILRRTGLLSMVKRILAKTSPHPLSEYTTIVKAINQSLLAENLIKKSLSETEISQLIDFHSPTAAGFDKEKGIDIQAFAKKYLRHYSFEYYKTYNHVYRLSHKNSIFRHYSHFLSRRYPQDGAAFFAILRKDK